MALTMEDVAKRMAQIVRVNGNDRCLHCSGVNPQWVTLTYGVFVCLDCSGRHRGLGTHLSFVRSVSMDKFTDEQLKYLELGGNAPFAAYVRAHGVDALHVEAMRACFESRAAQAWRWWLRRRVADDADAPAACPHPDAIPRHWVEFDLAPRAQVDVDHMPATSFSSAGSAAEPSRMRDLRAITVISATAGLLARQMRAVQGLVMDGVAFTVPHLSQCMARPDVVSDDEDVGDDGMPWHRRGAVRGPADEDPLLGAGADGEREAAVAYAPTSMSMSSLLTTCFPRAGGSAYGAEMDDDAAPAAPVHDAVSKKND